MRAGVPLEAAGAERGAGADRVEDEPAEGDLDMPPIDPPFERDGGAVERDGGTVTVLPEEDRGAVVVLAGAELARGAGAVRVRVDSVPDVRGAGVELFERGRVVAFVESVGLMPRTRADDDEFDGTDRVVVGAEAGRVPDRSVRPRISAP
ncbi:MAG TPA: hypothetical protein VIV64_10290 [Gammaproteobacteria bacterium]